MASPFVGQIGLFGFNFPPKGWAFAAGQLMAISQNTALFSLLGTTYGGDGKSTFALPNLTDGVTPLQVGQGPGLSLYDLGETGGSETITLLQTEMPTHTHNIGVYSGAPDKSSPLNADFATGGPNLFGPPNATLNAQLNPVQAISIVGGSQPHENMQPYLTLNFCIALQGVYPARS
jgi:microcystin-dependent protein